SSSATIISYTSFTPPHSSSFTAPPTTEIYTLSLHDALPISAFSNVGRHRRCGSPNLSCETELLRVGKMVCSLVHLDRQIYRFLPNLKFLVILQSSRLPPNP